MNKVSRTFRLPYELSKKLDSICIRSGDVTWHTEKALTAYLTDFAPRADMTPAPVKKAAKRFIRPTVSELAEQFHLKGSPTCNDDAQAFHDHYESNGWKVGKNAMKNWKSAINNWMRGKGNENNKSGSTKRSSISEQQTETRRQGEQIRANIASSGNGHAPMGEDGSDIRGQVVLTIGSDDGGRLI